jgi:hypothetical protein
LAFERALTYRRIVAAERLCPRCGAYWRCDCILDEWRQPLDESCRHDWLPAMGVELEEGLPDEAMPIMCRLCGLFAVQVPQA